MYMIFLLFYLQGIGLCLWIFRDDVLCSFKSSDADSLLVAHSVDMILAF